MFAFKYALLRASLNAQTDVKEHVLTASDTAVPYHFHSTGGCKTFSRLAKMRCLCKSSTPTRGMQGIILPVALSADDTPSADEPNQTVAAVEFDGALQVLIPTSQFVRSLVAARLAADVSGVPTVLIARTDAHSANLLTSDVDERDTPFIHGERTPEGFYQFNGGIKVRMHAFHSASFTTGAAVLLCVAPVEQSHCWMKGSSFY